MENIYGIVECLFLTTETIFKNFEVLMEEHTEIFNEIRKELKENLYGEELSQIVNHI